MSVVYLHQTKAIAERHAKKFCKLHKGCWYTKNWYGYDDRDKCIYMPSWKQETWSGQGEAFEVNDKWNNILFRVGYWE